MLALLAVLIVACSVITPFLVQVNSQALTLIVLSLFGASAVGWNGVYLAEVARQAPKGQASIATGGTLCVTFLGIVIGPPIFGLIPSAFCNYGLAFASLAVPAGLCMLLVLCFRKADREGGGWG